jgi:outer membrane lipoprotein-sorting protein
MPKLRLALGLAVLLLTAAILPLAGCGGGEETTTTPTPTIGTPSATVSSPSGEVQVKKKDSTAWISATNGMKLAVGDTMKTGSDSSAELRFFEGSVMEVEANSEIEIQDLTLAATGSTSVGLKQLLGNTVNRVEQLVDSASKYEVETPAATAVVRGTAFNLEVEQNGFTSIQTTEGSVSFTAAGVTVTVNQGQQSTAAVGGTPSTPSTITTATPTATSGETLGDIYGVNQNIGDLRYDMIMSGAGIPEPVTEKVYIKDAWLSDRMKFRYETTSGGFTTIYLMDLGTRIAYMWLKEQNIAYLIDMGQAPSDPTENADQIVPVKVGTETLDGKLCDVYQYTFENISAAKVWVWKEKSFPIRMEATTSSGTMVIEYDNIVFGPLSNDLFQLPAGVQIMQFPQ